MQKYGNNGWNNKSVIEQIIGNRNKPVICK
jgi:hypothetical protein